MTCVTVMRDKWPLSWPQLDPTKPLRPSDRAYVLELAAALEREYTTDAHFTAYHARNRQRLNVEAIGRNVPIELTCVVFDVDAPGHIATPEWRREIRGKVCALAEKHPGLFWYETRGGGRIVFKQTEPTRIKSHDDARAWRQTYAICIAYLSRSCGIEADPACSDWQRLYRLPRAKREPGGKPENWPTFGDARNIGTLVIDATQEDVETARRASKAFRDYSRKLDLSAPGRVDAGLFYWALKLRGDVGSEAPRGGWICHCPNRAQHTIKTDGTDSTVVYPAKDGRETGIIVCKHGHCENLSLTQWLRFFSDGEIEAASRAAGIAERGRAA
jgi:hypothetical protein